MVGDHSYFAIAAVAHPSFDANYWVVVATAAPVIALAGIVSLADTNRRYGRFADFLDRNFTIDDDGSSEPTKETPIAWDVYQRFSAALRATYASLAFAIVAFVGALISLETGQNRIIMPLITGVMVLSLVLLAAAPLVTQHAASNEGAARREYLEWRAALRKSSAPDQG